MSLCLWPVYGDRDPQEGGVCQACFLHVVIMKRAWKSDGAISDRVFVTELLTEFLCMYNIYVLQDVMYHLFF